MDNDTFPLSGGRRGNIFEFLNEFARVLTIKERVTEKYEIFVQLRLLATEELESLMNYLFTYLIVQTQRVAFSAQFIDKMVKKDYLLIVGYLFEILDAEAADVYKIWKEENFFYVSTGMTYSDDDIEWSSEDYLRKTKTMETFVGKSLEEKKKWVAAQPKFCNNTFCKKRKYFLNDENVLMQRTMYWCKRCKKRLYCCRKCQKVDWNNSHFAICKK